MAMLSAMNEVVLFLHIVGALLFVAGIVFAGIAFESARARQRPKQARLLATELAERGEGVSPELRALLDDRASRLANQASAVLVVAVLALMVFKP